jgi:cephalosporin hydroxylase
MNTLAQIYQNRRKGDWPDKGTVHSYIDVYEKLLADYRGLAKNVLEIGIAGGESLLMFEDYFWGADVYGMDCSETPVGGAFDLRPLISAGHKIKIGNAESEQEVDALFGDIKFDVIIEDAGHQIDQQLAIYQNFRNRMSWNGLYVIEDIADPTAFSDKFTKAGYTFQIVDLRRQKGRFDDVLAIFT